ncbi:unnamed protein product [Schistosoma curassoni]|uniref:Uncharacterized protein n=1 Tax=Schistosoma curassoni TaxID=6186 RepID=A0A183JVQ4_9TREM|nr:unnamed protein product [Schistosoma curassoni]
MLSPDFYGCILPKPELVVIDVDLRFLWHQSHESSTFQFAQHVRCH